MWHKYELSAFVGYLIFPQNNPRNKHYYCACFTDWEIEAYIGNRGKN